MKTFSKFISHVGKTAVRNTLAPAVIPKKSSKREKTGYIKGVAKSIARHLAPGFVPESEVAANAMGASSSTPGTGAIDTIDPLLLKKILARLMNPSLRSKKPKKN